MSGLGPGGTGGTGVGDGTGAELPLSNPFAVNREVLTKSYEPLAFFCNNNNNVFVSFAT